MSGHYCTEHKTVFFKKGKMRGYAHPIGDTGEWCNEPEEGGDPIPEEKKAELGFDPQELGMWYKEIGLNYRAGKLEGTTGKALMAAYWARMFTVIGVTKE